MSASTLSKADQIRLARFQTLQKEVTQLEEEMKGHDCEMIVKDHIRALNEYNERKDACSILIGKIAEFENTTITKIYERLGLSIED